MKKLIFNILLLLSITASLAQNTYTKINLLDKVSFSDTISLEDIFLISKRAKLRKLYIQALNNQIIQLNNKISLIEQYSQKLQRQLNVVEKNYSKIIVFTYLAKTMSPSDFILIFSSRSLNQAYSRLQYLQLITQYLKKTAKTIQLLQQELKIQKNLLQKSLALRKNLLRKISEQKSLVQEDYVLLQSINSQQQQLQFLKQQLNSYQEQQNFIKQFIFKNVNSYNNSYNLKCKFALSKGLLPAPIKNPIIVIPFGIHEHKQLKGIKIQNNGVDITSFSDNTAKAVFNGTVVKIFLLPNGTYAILLKHNGGFYTVYANLKKTYVHENQKVTQYQKLGKIAKLKSERYPVLNFQIWYKTQKLNPQNWIKL